MTGPSKGTAARALTVDLWHTLVYLEPNAEEAYMRAQLDLATEILAAAPPADGTPPPDPLTLRRSFERVYAEAISAAQEGRSVSPAQQMEEAGRRAGVRPAPEHYYEGLFHLVNRTPFLPAPGALDVLRHLRADGWAVGVVSNTVGEPGEALRPVLNRLGLDQVVETFVFSDEEPWTKPSPAIFGAALERLGAEARSAVHVGDGWVDIEGARRAGFRAGVLFTGLQHYAERYRRLFLPEGWSNPPTPYRLGTWGELPDLLARLP